MRLRTLLTLPKADRGFFNRCEMSYDKLKYLQSLPLEIKIAKTQERLYEWIKHFGINNVYISYSGGKDSEVLLDIARQDYHNIKAVFCNTTMEFPETVKQVLKRCEQGYNIDIIRPKMSFAKVIEKYGYPVVSKEQSRYIYDVCNSKSEKLIKTRLEGREYSKFCISDKWRHLIHADFKISDKCCDVLKKRPFKTYLKETGRTPIVATMAGESKLRQTEWGKNGCNGFNLNNPTSKPISFWLESDIWQYIDENSLEVSEMYTEHGARRTGCYGCLFGCHMEEKETGTNRIVQLKQTHPKLYNYLFDKLNYKHVMQKLGLKTGNEVTIENFIEEV